MRKVMDLRKAFRIVPVAAFDGAFIGLGVAALLTWREVSPLGVASRLTYRFAATVEGDAPRFRPPVPKPSLRKDPARRASLGHAFVNQGGENLVIGWEKAALQTQ